MHTVLKWEGKLQQRQNLKLKASTTAKFSLTNSVIVTLSIIAAMNNNFLIFPNFFGGLIYAGVSSKQRYSSNF